MAYPVDPLEILIVGVFAKKTQTTPQQIVTQCKQRLRAWDRDND
jgi:phage-related protein